MNFNYRLGLINFTAVTLLSGCGFFAKKPDPNPLCKAECPDLTALPDDSFGATSKKLKETADTYYNCRKACQEQRK